MMGIWSVAVERQRGGRWVGRRWGDTEGDDGRHIHWTDFMDNFMDSDCRNCRLSCCHMRCLLGYCFVLYRPMQCKVSSQPRSTSEDPLNVWGAVKSIQDGYISVYICFRYSSWER